MHKDQLRFFLIQSKNNNFYIVLVAYPGSQIYLRLREGGWTVVIDNIRGQLISYKITTEPIVCDIPLSVMGEFRGTEIDREFGYAILEIANDTTHQYDNKKVWDSIKELVKKYSLEFKSNKQ